MHPLNRCISVLVIRAYFDGNDRAALVPVRALPVFVCRSLIYCGSGKFPQAPRRPPIAEARDGPMGQAPLRLD